MKLASPAFDNEGSIPSKYTCDGDNISPPLIISDVPAAAQTLVLTMDDPDVPKKIRADGIWDHWVVYNIPAEVTEVGEGKEPPGDPGLGTSGDTTYFGPCPPDREHRYYFHLYALDTRLSFKKSPTKDQVIKAMAGHVLERASTMGRYRRQR